MTAKGRVSVGDLYEAIVDDDAWASLPAMAARLVGARSSVIVQLDPNGSVDWRSSYLSDGIMHDLALWHPDGRDIWVETGLRTGVVGRALSIDTVLAEKSYLDSVLWNEIFRRHGDDTGRSMGIVHPLGAGTLLLTFQQAFGAGAFTRQNLARVDLIANDVHRIHRSRRLLGARDGRIARLEALLAGDGSRVLLLGRGLRLIEASPNARSLLERGDGLTLRRGVVVPSDRHVAKPFARIVEATIRREPVAQATLLCGRPAGGAPWRVLVLPAPIEGGDWCMVTIGGGDVAGGRRRRWLHEQYGATAAEIAVAEALVAGAAPEEVAAGRGTSLHTVRTQIRRLMEKTGARGIGQLLVLLARLE